MTVVYGLVHVASGRTYVGCTAGKPQKRLREHRCLLNQGKHAERVLQNEWRSYGPEAFVMKVLEVLPGVPSAAKKREAELRWMNKLEEEGLLYNRNMTSFQFVHGATEKGIEASRKAGRWHKGVPKDHGAKISLGKKRARILRQSNEIV